MEEFNTIRRLGYKVIEDSDWRNKLKVLCQQTVHVLEEEIHKQLQRRTKLVIYHTIFVEEKVKEEMK